jgi:hypothetical protein
VQVGQVNLYLHTGVVAQYGDGPVVQVGRERLVALVAAVLVVLGLVLLDCLVVLVAAGALVVVLVVVFMVVLVALVALLHQVVAHILRGLPQELVTERLDKIWFTWILIMLLGNVHILTPIPTQML